MQYRNLVLRPRRAGDPAVADPPGAPGLLPGAHRDGVRHGSSGSSRSTGSGTPACCRSTTCASTCSPVWRWRWWCARSPSRCQEWWQRREEPAWVGAFGGGLVAVASPWWCCIGAFSVLPGGYAPAPIRPTPEAIRLQLGRHRLRDDDRAQLGPLQLRRARGQGTPIPSSPRSSTRWRRSATSTAAAGRCGSTRATSTATAPRWRSMLLPYFTDGCIGSMEGLYFESSTTTPFHFLNQSELSTGAVARPARPALHRVRHRQPACRTCR